MAGQTEAGCVPSPVLVGGAGGAGGEGTVSTGLPPAFPGISKAGEYRLLTWALPAPYARFPIGPFLSFLAP